MTAWQCPRCNKRMDMHPCVVTVTHHCTPSSRRATYLERVADTDRPVNPTGEPQHQAEQTPKEADNE